MFIKSFSDITKDDASIAGGKGASLGEMTRAGIPVPPGFVILSEAFEQFLTETDLVTEVDTILHSVNTQAMHTVEHASERIQKLILEATMPENIARDIETHFRELRADYVAVRSSATAEDSASAAWAGQLDSFLNTTEATLLGNVQRCWASLFTPRAIFYRFEQGLHDSKISVAVVVQQMVASEVSGIAFSVHPVTEDHNQLIIEAGYGLGEAIVSGQITPDSYIVEKNPRRIIDKNIVNQERGIFRALNGGNEWQDIDASRQEQPKLSDDQILELSEIIVTIESHYGFPCDIEWAYADSKFYIVQSRPITTLNKGTVQSGVITLSKVYSREKSLFYLDVWDKSDRLGIDRYIGGSIERGSLFVAQPDGLCEVWYDSDRIAALTEVAIARLGRDQKLVEDITTTLEGHWKALQKYFETSQMIKTITEAREYYDHLVGFWSGMNTILFELAGNPRVPEQFSQVLFRMREKSQEYTNEMSEKFVTFFSQTYPQYVHLARMISIAEAEDLVTTNDAELLRRLEDRLREGCFLFDQKIKPYPELVITLEQAKVALAKPQLVFQKTYERDFTLILEQSWLESFGDIRGRYHLSKQHVPLVALFVTEENLQIWERTDGMQAFLDWLLEKNMSESDFLASVISEYQGILKQVEVYWKQGGIADLDSFEAYTKLLRQGMSLFSLWYYSGVDERTPKEVRDLAINCREGDDFFAANDTYIKACLKAWGVKASLANLILLSERKGIPNNHLLKERRSGILVFDGETDVYITPLEEFVATHPGYLFEGIGKGEVTAGEIHGQVAYRGNAQGKVRIVKNKNQLVQVGVGDIIVSPMTTPDFVPGMQKAVAFVTDEGGVMCHAAIVAREMKKPCIIGTKIATQVLKDGDLVEVDADNGVVRIVGKVADVMIKELGVYSWQKNFQGVWSLYECCYYGEQMEKGLREAYGEGLTHIAFIFRNGVTTNYVVTEEVRGVSHLIADSIEEYPDRAKELASRAIQEADETLHMIREAQKGAVTIREIEKLWQKLEHYYFASFPIKKAVEYVSPATQEMILPLFQKARVHGEPVYAEAARLVRKFGEQVATLAQLPVDLVLSLTREELKDYVDKGVLPSTDELQQRYEASVLVFCNGQRVLVKGEQAATLEASLLRLTSNVTSLNGVTAYGGKVSGRVRVILNPTEVRDYVEGSVLVTGMTRPEYLSLVKNSSALITDAGGVLSHAAITARELQIPTIIGTGIATQVLKDGDLVEVDADSGVVRKLNRNGSDMPTVDPFFTPENFGFNFNGKGIRVLFEDFDLPFYCPSQTATFSVNDEIHSFFSHVCFADMAQRAGTREFLEELLARSVQTLENSRQAIATIPDIVKKEVLTFEDLDKMREVFKELFTGFSYFNNGYLDPLFQFAATLPKSEQHKLEQVGKFKNDIRDTLNTLLFEKDGYFFTVLKKVAAQFSIPVEDLEYYREHELRALFDGSQLVLATAIADRKRAFVYLKNGDSLTFFEGDAAERFAHGFLPSEETNRASGQITGMVAHNPHRVVRGVVRRIITDYSEMERMHREADAMQPGEILVSQLTAPEIMTACKKASAIITDIGGMLSHAAIVSREFNTPCIVGTKNASKLLNTGDLVEVDAERGVVRIIERV